MAADGGAYVLPDVTHHADYDAATIHARYAGDVLSLPPWRMLLGLYGVVVLDGPTGTGKTQAVAALTRDLPLVGVSDRRGLVSQLATTFGAVPRLLHATGQEHRSWARGDRIATTVQSPALLVVDTRGRQLVVDEAQRVLDTVAIGRDIRPRSRPRVEEGLARMIRDADRTWLIEAGWTDEDLRTWAAYLRARGVGHRILHVRIVPPPVERYLQPEYERTTLFEHFCACVEEGRPAILFSTSKQACHRIAAEVRRRTGKDILALTSETSDSPRVMDWIADPTATREPWVVASPSVVSGLDIRARADGTAEYGSVYLDGLVWHGRTAPGLSDLIQFAGRVRECRHVEVWVTPDDRGIPTYPEATALEDCLQGATTERLATAATSGAGDRSAYAQAAADSARPRSVLDWLAEWRGTRRARSWASPTAGAGEVGYPVAAYQDAMTALGWTILPPRIVEVREFEIELQRKTWRMAREREDVDYAVRVRRGPRGRASWQVARAGCEEMGHPAPLHGGPLDGADGADLQWLLAEHRGHTPVTLALATFARDRALDADADEADYPSRSDRRWLATAGDLIRQLIVAMGIDPDRLAAGGDHDIERAGLAEYTRVASSFPDEMLHRLGLSAPMEEWGRVRCALTVLTSIGCEYESHQVEREPAPDGKRQRPRVYTVRLAPQIVDAVRRRTAGPPPPPPLPGTLSPIDTPSTGESVPRAAGSTPSGGGDAPGSERRPRRFQFCLPAGALAGVVALGQDDPEPESRAPTPDPTPDPMPMREPAPLTPHAPATEPAPTPESSRATEPIPAATVRSGDAVDLDLAVVRTLIDRAPLHVLPSAASVIEPLRAAAAANDDPQVRSRLTQVVTALGSALAGDGVLRARSWTREPSGRIHMVGPPIQGTPGEKSRVNVRPHVAAGRGMMFVSGDYCNMHAAIAARWTGDPALYALVSGDAYAALAREILPDVPPDEARRRAKLALLSTLNGATVDTLTRHLGSPEAAAALWSSLPSRLPGLMARWAEAQRLHRSGAPSVLCPSLSGSRTRTIPRKDGRGGWRRYLYALWAVTEAETMDRVLASLPAGSRVAVPLYDGILPACRAEDTDRVARELREVMLAAALASGFEARVKVGIGQSWGEAEESAE